MVKPKHPKDFSTEEVGMFLVAIGLGSKVETFKEAGVDGAMLVILDGDDATELGLSSLQGKKIMTSLETAIAMAEGGGGGSSEEDAMLIQNLQREIAALRAQVGRTNELQDEVAALRQQLAEYQERDARVKAQREQAQRDYEAQQRARQQAQYSQQQSRAPPPSTRQGGGGEPVFTCVF